MKLTFSADHKDGGGPPPIPWQALLTPGGELTDLGAERITMFAGAVALEFGDQRVRVADLGPDLAGVYRELTPLSDVLQDLLSDPQTRADTTQA